MSTAGRPRKPSATKQAQGTERPSRTNPDEPDPSSNAMSPPAYLSDAAKANFAQLVLEMDEIGIASSTFNTITSEAAILMETVENCDIYLQAFFKKERCYSYTTSNSFGDKIHKPLPEMQIRSDSMQKLKGCLSSLGLSPSDISKVSGKKKTPAKVSKWGELASIPGGKK